MRLFERRLRHGVNRNRIVVLHAAHRLLRDQPLEPCFLTGRLLGARLRFGQRIFIVGRVNLEQRLPGLDRHPLFVQAFQQDAADAGADFGFARAFGLGHDFDDRRQIDRLHLQHRHRQCRRCCRLRRWRRLVGTGAEQQGQQDRRSQNGFRERQRGGQSKE